MTNSGSLSSDSLFSDDHPFSPPKSKWTQVSFGHYSRSSSIESIPSLLSEESYSDESDESANPPPNLPAPKQITEQEQKQTAPSIPTQPPTMQWSNSPQKTKHTNAPKKKSRIEIDDNRLLQAELLKRSNDTIIKLYFFPNYSNIELLTKFQNYLITQHRFDLILLTYLDYTDPKFEHNTNWISKNNRRVKGYYSAHHRLSMLIHGFVDILERASTETHIEKLNEWFISLVDQFHLCDFYKEYEGLQDCMKIVFSSAEHPRITALLAMIKRSFEEDSSEFHLDKIHSDELWVLLTFHSFAAGIIYNSKMVSLNQNNALFENVTDERGQKYVMGLREYAMTYHRWMTGEDESIRMPNVQYLFEGCIRNLNHFCIADCIHDWKFKEHENENRYRNIHVVIVDDNIDKLKELLGMIAKEKCKAFKIEQFNVRIKKTKSKKTAFDIVKSANEIYLSAFSSGNLEKQKDTKAKKKRSGKCRQSTLSTQNSEASSFVQ